MAENTRYETVGELKAALADMDDTIPLARRDGIGGWVKGIEAGTLNIIVVGEDGDTMGITEGDDFLKKWKGKRRDPLQVVAFD